MITDIAHLSFTVSDLDRSMAFYCDLIGFKKSFVVERSGPVTESIVGIPGARIKIGMLTLKGIQLELIQYLHPTGQKIELRANNVGCAHIAFFVENIKQIYRDFSSKGVQFRSEPVQIKDGPSAGWKSVYALDPDGIIVEFMQKPTS